VDRKAREVILKNQIKKTAPACGETQITYGTDLLDDLMLDSISIMQLIVSIEEEFDIEISDENLTPDKLNTFGKLLDIVEESG